MYASRTTQFIVGIFGVVGIAALAILSLELGKIPLLEPPSYTLYANFDNVSGLKTADSVEIAGVEVGKVVAISLNQERARVTMQIHNGVKIDDEAIAAIKTSGIIGEKYVSIALGAGERILKGGDNIMQTESAFVLEDAIGQLINSSGTSSGGSEKDKGDKGGAGNQSKPDSNKDPVSASKVEPTQSNPFIGTWKLDKAMSKFSPGPPPFQSRTSTYEAHGDGIKYSSEGTNSDGSHVAWGYTANYDEKDTPVSGTGPGSADTVALKRINSNTIETTFKKRGKVVASGRSVVSADGKVMTIKAKTTTPDGKPQRLTLVFEKK